MTTENTTAPALPAIEPELIQWLANGERGLSSETIVTHLTGINALGRWQPTEPADPDDLHRCRELLRRVPSLAARLPEMATCSPEWAALVPRWDELCALMDQEAPNWPAPGCRAPQTYALMRALIEGAEVAHG